MSFVDPPRESPPTSGTPVWVWFAIANLCVVALLAGAGMWIWVSARSAPVPSPIARPIPAAPPAAPVANGDSSAISSGPGTNGESTPETSRVVADVKFGVVHLTSKNSKGDTAGFGSGFVIDPAGLVATNYHVIRGATSVEAAFFDGRTVDVKGLRAWDADADLAIVELAEAPPQMQSLRLADGADPPHATAVIAIGHPRGFRFTTTTGIVSAIHATSDLPAEYREAVDAPADNVWIQTNAAISGGSSGGPLLSSRGEVLGVNTWIVPGENIGFAVDARHVAALKAAARPRPVSFADVTAPEEAAARILGDFNSQFGWFATHFRTAKTDQERRELVESRHPSPEFARRLCELAEKHPGTPAAFECLLGVCQVVAVPETPKSCDAHLDRARKQLLDNFRSDRKLLKAAFAVANTTLPAGRELLRQIVESAEEDRTKAVALYCLATSLQIQDESTPVSSEAISALERIVNDFDSVEYRGQSLSQAASTLLFTLRHLSIGRSAMEIDGKDVDGNPLRLSDYRGKVVVLDFWADWCPHCVAMYPLERKLTEELKDKPFAILGINCDSPERLRRLVQNRTVTWKNWSDGPGGPIAQNWRIDAFPTLYVLDGEGVIRYRNVRDDELVKAIDALLAEMGDEPAEAELPARTAAAPE